MTSGRSDAAAAWLAEWLEEAGRRDVVPASRRLS
jgi:hypothetical protein